MFLTVAVCTWNRAALLDRTLAEMAHLRVRPGDEWELLVVNNNCTDDTDAVIARHAARLPLKRLFEPEPGHSNARNRAVAAARGDLVVWTDDDVLVAPDWLTEYANAADGFPAAAYFGGTVDPWFEAPPPRWVGANLDLLSGAFAVRQLGPTVRPLAPGESVFGASLAFRRAVLPPGAFDPRLGRTGAGMLSGDETAVIDRVRAAGGFGVWVGTARVRHFIPTDRATAAYVWRFFHGLGRTRQRMERFDRGVPLVRGRPRWLVRRYLAAAAVELALRPVRSRAWVRALVDAAAFRGILDECGAAPGGD